MDKSSSFKDLLKAEKEKRMRMSIEFEAINRQLTNIVTRLAQASFGEDQLLDAFYAQLMSEFSKKKFSEEKLEKLYNSINNRLTKLNKLSDIKAEGIQFVIQEAETSASDAPEQKMYCDDASISAEQKEEKLQYANAVGEFLRDLLEYIPIPRDFEDEGSNIIQDVQDGIMVENLNVVLDKSYFFIIKSLSREKFEFEKFIESLNNRFLALEKLVNKTSESVHDSNDDTKNLDKSFREQFSQIADSFGGYDSIGDLEQTISSKLDQVINELDIYKEKEQERLQDFENQTKELVEKLKETEEQTHGLKKTLNQQRMLARVDSLTSLPNRAAYEEHMDAMLSNEGHSPQKIIFAVGDIDNFKKLNDTYGHIAGDKVLAKVAFIMNETVGDKGFVCRYGGEEFVISLPGLNAESGVEVLNSVRANIEKVPFYFKSKDNIIRVTISFGATCSLESDNKQVLFERADQALYKAKEVKNRVIFKDSP